MAVGPRRIVLCALTFVGSVATLKMRAAPVSFSISDTFTLMTLLLLGPGAADDDRIALSRLYLVLPVA